MKKNFNKGDLASCVTLELTPSLGPQAPRVNIKKAVFAIIVKQAKKFP